MSTFFTLLVATLTQVLGAFYNYQYLNALGVDQSLHPLTLEDNIHTALTQLPTFVTSIMFPLFFGFSFSYHLPTNKLSNDLSIQTDFEIGKQFLYMIAAATLLGISTFAFLSTRQAIYACVYIGIAMLCFAFFRKIKVFSIKDDIPTICACVSFTLLLIVTNLHQGELKGLKDKSEMGAKYLIKTANPDEEYLACSSIRTYANDFLLVKNGRVSFVSKDSVKEITVLN